MQVNKLEVIKTRSRWHELVSSFTYKDFYHSWDFHAISEKNGEGSPVMLFRCFDEQTAIALPFLVREEVFAEQRVKDATSVYGYSGPLVQGILTDEHIQIWATEVLAWLKDEDVLTFFSRLNPLIDTLSVSQALGEVVPCGQTVPIDLSLPLDMQRQHYRSSSKRHINRLTKMGAKCVPGHSSADIDAFMNIYKTTMDRLAAAPYYYFDRSYYELLLAATDFDARLYLVVLDKKVIATGIFVFDTDIVQYHLGGTNPDFYNLTPIKFMFDTVRLDANKQGMKWFHLGGGAGSKEDSLYHFKSGFSRISKRFSVLKVVTDSARYNKICAACEQEAKVSGVETDYNYFPLYRGVKKR